MMGIPYDDEEIEIYWRAGTPNDALQATHAARRRLLALHEEEYTEILRQERVARGLPPYAQILAQWKKRIKQLEAELAELKGDGDADQEEAEQSSEPGQ
jgi:hypothetical protein